tara:strand:+ start:59 stop:967 length:909 start_codon:yes stop_codon:yes gene_type:complete
VKSISVLGIFVADIIFFGKNIPEVGETVLGNKYVIGPGGKGSNQAVAAAKAGGSTFFISKIGDDQFGEMAKKIYDEVGVDYSKVIISKEHLTGAAGILINEKGENSINVVPGASGTLTIDDIDRSLDIIKNSSIFLTQLEAPKEVVFYALKKAKENNISTILNPAPAADIDPEIFPLIDFFTPNEIEASYYVNNEVKNQEDAKKASKHMLEMGIKNIIITLGDKGAYFASKNEEFYVDALKLKVLDTTGAGDAFNGALAVALIEDKNMKEAVNFANLAAGLSTTKIGTANSMPSRSEIDKIF